MHKAAGTVDREIGCGVDARKRAARATVRSLFHWWSIAGRPKGNVRTARRMLRVARRHEPDTAAKRCRAAEDSIFLRQHDRHDTRGHVLVGRVGRAVVEITIVAIDLPEDRLAGILEAAEIVLAMRVVVRCKGDEAMNAPHDLDLLLRRHGGNARGDVDAPVSGEGSPERIVQLANSRCRIHTLLM